MANYEASQNIYFSWSRNIALDVNGTGMPKDPVNLVATSSRFDLVFIANGSELQCTSVPDIENEHSFEKILPDSTEHKFSTISAGGVITGVFVSADETTVAVCTENLFCHLFDTRAFFDNTPHPIGPYYTVRLSSAPGVALRDFAFNPVITDMFAVVMSDGKVTNYEIASSNGQFTLKIHGSYEGAQCCSWSPKGKQLVVAKGDGTLVQLKPNMAEAKTIPPPTLENFANPKPKAIFWASSTVFVVAYWASNSVQVAITILNKNAPTVHIPFQEPCLRNLDEEEFSRTWFCHVPVWNLLLMVCRNSPDVAVFAHNENCTKWTFYDIEGERAALPIVKKLSTYPLGICLNTSSTRAVEKKNQNPKPPAPMILLATTGRTLCPYYLINDGAKERLNTPPEDRSTHGMRRMLNPLPGTPKSQTETPVGAVSNKDSKAAPFSFSSMYSPSKPSGDPLTQSTPLATTFLGDQPKAFGTAPSSQLSFSQFSMPTPKPQEMPKAPIASAAAAPQQIQQVPMAAPVPQPPKPSPIKVTPKLESISQAPEEDESLSQETLSRAFFNELDGLTRELGDLKMRSSEVLALPIGEEKSLTAMRSETKGLMEKMDEIRTNLKTMKADVHEAEKVLIDALACGTQLKTITAAKDSRISRMDPITQATLKQAQGLAQYLERQLINANNVLDDAYEKHKNDKSFRKRTPTTEMLCRTILSCDKTIEALREELTNMRNKVDSIKRMQALRERKNEDLTSLADSLLVVGIDSKDADQTQNGKKSDHQSFEKIKMLKDYLASRPVTEVTPSKLSPHGESMIVSKLSTILEQSRIEVASEKKQTGKGIRISSDDMPRESIGGVLGLRPNVDLSAVTPMKPPAAVTSTPFAKPGIEPISPPADAQAKNLATSSFFQFQDPAKPVQTGLTFPKPSSEKTALSFQPTPGAGTAASVRPFSFDLPKTPEAQKTSSTKPKVTFTFEPPNTPKSKDSEAATSKSASVASSTPGSMFTFATTTAKPQPSTTGTDFSFAVKKDASPSKDFFSPANLGFSLSKKEEASAGSPSKSDSVVKQTTPVISDKPAPTSSAASTGFSFSLTDKKTDTATKSPGAAFSFSFGAKPADQQADKTEKPTAAAPSAFKLADSGAQFSFGKTLSSLGAIAELEKSKTQPQSATEPTLADKPASTPFSFSFSKADAKPVTAATTAAEPPKPSFNFSFGGATTVPAVQKASSEAAESVTEVTTEPTSSVADTTESKTLDSEDSSQKSNVSSETSAKTKGESITTAESSASVSIKAQESSTEISADAEDSGDAQVPGSVPATEPPTTSAVSFFAANRPTSIISPLSSSGTTTPSEGGTSIFGKPSGGSLFGKAPSGGLFGSSTAATFGQSSAFGSSPGTSLFGGSSTTTTTTSFFGNTLSSTTATAAPTATTTASKPFGAFGASQTPTDSPAQAATSPTTKPFGAFGAPQIPTDSSAQAATSPTTNLFGSPSAFGASSVFGTQGSAFAPTTTSAFGSGIAFGSTTTTAPAFGQNLSTTGFGAQAKPQTELFGKSTSTSSGSLFGQKSTFGTSSTGTSLFGGNASPSTGGFMSGLGQAGTPTAKNAFGGGTFGQNPQSTNLFGSGGATAFGAQPTYGGVTAMSNMTPKESPFALGSTSAAKPTFGGAPTFGGSSPGGFGSAPTFGSAPAFGSPSAFGTAAQSSAFGNVANTPTFGSLAQNQPTFGSPSAGAVFGAAPGAQGFPAAATTPPKSAAFTQYRG